MKKYMELTEQDKKAFEELCKSKGVIIPFEYACEYYSDGVLHERANAQERIKELEEALSGILDIGKRDTTNPKYDGYYRTAKEVMAKKV